ncbi:MAG: DUF86 domain-containing protein [Saprospiraceae bacterium]|nr:DUF86 domain-containing protein [Saprospiraceae bacterium]
MSDRPTYLLLYDILDALDNISLYIEHIDFNNFSNNSMIRNAVERNIEIIGEASNKILEEFRKSNPDIEWHKPIAMRNRLIHGYFAIDIPMLWNTITVILPPFRDSIIKLIESSNRET